MKLLLFCSLFCSSFFLQAQSQLKVMISNCKNSKGQVVVALFDNETDFLKKVYDSRIVPASSSGEVVAIFDKVPTGKYAVSVIHDENKNTKLDTNFVGIPKESFGFSQNAKGTFGPPSFNAASIVIDDDDQTIRIKLNKLI